MLICRTDPTSAHYLIFLLRFFSLHYDGEYLEWLWAGFALCFRLELKYTAIRDNNSLCFTAHIHHFKCYYLQHNTIKQAKSTTYTTVKWWLKWHFNRNLQCLWLVNTQNNNNHGLVCSLGISSLMLILRIILQCLFAMLWLFMPLSLFEIFEFFLAMSTGVVQCLGVLLFVCGQITFVYCLKSEVLVGTFSQLLIVGFNMCS